MEKDPRLINIYLTIHNKRPLTMDDLQYLAIYSPECFEKTCKNVVYNFPSAKSVMEPKPVQESAHMMYSETNSSENNAGLDIYASEESKINQILNNLRKLEKNQLPQTDVDINKVKDLLGNLFMELIFPHNDQLLTLWMPEQQKHNVDFRA